MRPFLLDRRVSWPQSMGSEQDRGRAWQNEKNRRDSRNQTRRPRFSFTNTGLNQAYLVKHK
jgi:hypothetical protein